MSKKVMKMDKPPISVEELDEEERRMKDSVHQCPKCGILWDCDVPDGRECKIAYICNCGSCQT